MKAAATAPLALLQPALTPEAKICLFTDRAGSQTLTEPCHWRGCVAIGDAFLWLYEPSPATLESYSSFIS